MSTARSSSRWRTALAILAALSLGLALGACDDPQPSGGVADGGASDAGGSPDAGDPTVDCGDGVIVVDPDSGAVWCVYQGAITETGFDCPENQPYGYAVAGSLACGDAEVPPGPEVVELVGLAGAQAPDCQGGTSVLDGGEYFCLYDEEFITETGFQCPSLIPEMYFLGDGAVACGPEGAAEAQMARLLLKALETGVIGGPGPGPGDDTPCDVTSGQSYAGDWTATWDGVDVGGATHDALGRLWVVGTTTQAVVLGLDSAGAQVTVEPGPFFQTLFLARIAPDGAVELGRAIGGGTSLVAHDLAVRSDGSVVVAASSPDDVTFGEPPNEAAFAASADDSTYLVAFDEAGNAGASIGFIAPTDFEVEDARLAAHPSGSLSLALDLDNFDFDTLTSTEEARLHRVSDSMGQVWFVSAPGASFEGVAALGESAATVLTYDGGPLAFDGVEVLPEDPLLDAGLVVFDDSASVAWARKVGTGGADWLYAVDASAEQGVVIGGTFISDVEIDTGATPVVTEDTTPNEDVSHDALVVRYSANGEYQWHHRTNGVGWDEVRAVALADDGRVAFAGLVVGAMTFENGKIIGKLASATHQLFVAMLDDEGKLQWAETAGGEGDNAALVDFAGIDVGANQSVSVVADLSGDSEVGITETGFLKGENQSTVVMHANSDNWFCSE